MENENKVVQESTNEEFGKKTTSEEVVSTENVETKSNTAEVRCPKCQALLGEGQTFCPECGTPLKKLCQRCGAELQDGQAFCDKCGQKADGIADTNANSAINQFNTNVSAQQKKNKLIPIIIGVVCVAIVAVVILFGKAGSGISFEKEFADIADEYWCIIASDDSYMKLDTNPYDEEDEIEFDAWSAISEANTKLGFSEALMGKMGETRSMDGRQSDENDDIRVSWTYHPDKGLEVMYEKK